MATAIIFDLDGTLADSTDCVVGAAQEVGRALGFRPVSDDDIRARIGEPLGPMLAALFAIDGEDVKRAVADYSAEYVRLAKTGERPFEGSIPLLESLKSAGFKLAIATGKSQNGADRATERMGLAPHFGCIHGIIPGTPGKPDPAVLVRAMKALGVTASESIMVGDTTFDMDLSNAVGVRPVAVDWGMHSEPLLRSREPAFYAHTFAELQAWLLDQAP